MSDSVPSQIIHGSAFQMRQVASGTAALVLTSPPFFSDELEVHLRQPEKRQVDFDGISARITDYALRLRPAFTEIERVLMPGGHLVLETKDIRYSRALISLSDVHRHMAEATGLRLSTSVLWQNSSEAPHHGSRARVATELLEGKGFRTADTEKFFVFVKPEGREHLGAPEELAELDIEAVTAPVWHEPPSRSWHPHPSPEIVVRRFIQLLTTRGDLVVDPFAGAGTVLRVAAALGRKAIGYEIDRLHWERALGDSA